MNKTELIAAVAEQSGLSIPASKGPAFKAGKGFKDVVNK